VLRVPELEQYRALPAHEDGWIARALGLPLEEERRCLRLLLRAGQIERQAGRYAVRHVRRVDMRADPEQTRKLREFWLHAALARLRADAPGIYGYNLFAIAEQDLPRLEELHREYHEKMRALIASSQPEQRVALYCTQLLALGVPSARAKGGHRA